MAKIKSVLELEQCTFEGVGNAFVQVKRTEEGDAIFTMSECTKGYELIVSKYELVDLYSFLSDIVTANNSVKNGSLT